jgi:hypothetical protein
MFDVLKLGLILAHVRVSKLTSRRMTQTFAKDVLDSNIQNIHSLSFTLSEIFPVDIVITTPNISRLHREVNRLRENYLTHFRQQHDFTCYWPTAAHKMPTTLETRYKWTCRSERNLSSSLPIAQTSNPAKSVLIMYYSAYVNLQPTILLMCWHANASTNYCYQYYLLLFRNELVTEAQICLT